MSSEVDLQKFIKKLPNVELHAHLNGSISEKMMKQLLESKRQRDPAAAAKSAEWETCINKGQHRTLDEVFMMFSCIHQICDNKEDLYKVACDVITEFANDNVRYLELRTTPRAVDYTGMTKESYVSTVLDAIEDTMKTREDIEVYLILSLDRTQSVEEAWDTVSLAVKHREKSNGRIVGIDLSGDPNKGDARDFIPVLKEAKKQGLKLALHLAEIQGQEEETLALMTLPPDRIGHGTYLHPATGGTEQLLKMTRDSRVPLEICLTSNVIAKTVSSFDNSHFKHWFKENHPCVICTDDMGVFSTSLTEEYLIASQTFNLSRDQLWKLSHDSIDHIFAGQNIKDKLKDTWSTLKPDNINEN